MPGRQPDAARIDGARGRPGRGGAVALIAGDQHEVRHGPVRAEDADGAVAAAEHVARRVHRDAQRVGQRRFDVGSRQPVEQAAQPIGHFVTSRGRPQDWWRPGRIEPQAGDASPHLRPGGPGQAGPIRIRGCRLGVSQRSSRVSWSLAIETQPAVGAPTVTCRKNALPAPWRTPPGALRVL